MISVVENKARFEHTHISFPQEDSGDPESFPIRRLFDEMRQTELKYQLIYQNAPVGVLYFDNEGNILDCNAKFLQIVGSTREKVLKLCLLKMPDHKAVEAIKAGLSGRTGYYNGYYSSMTANKITPLRAVINPIFNKEEKIIGGIGIFEDMSEFKDTENRLQYHFNFERLISNISTQFVNSTVGEIDQVIENALKLTCEFFGVQRGYIFVTDKDRKTINNTHEWCSPCVGSLKSKYQNFSFNSFAFVEGFKKQLTDHLQICNPDELPPEEAEFKKLLEEDQTK